MSVVDLTREELVRMIREDPTLAAEIACENMKDKSYLDLPMGQEVGRYLRAKRKELTVSSYRGYETCLEKFARQFAHLQLEDLELPVGGERIEEWMDDRWGTAEPGTYNVNHAILKDFFRWQVRRQRMRSNPMELVGRAKKRQVYRQTFTEDECHAIVASAGDRRDRIAVRLLLYHGLRKGELAKVQIKHFDYPRRRLTVFGKGGKVATVPIPEPAFWTDLERYVLDAEAQDEHYLMCLHKPVPFGTPDAKGKRKTRVQVFPDRSMAATTLHNWWKARCREAGVRELKMHTTRHTAGQRILDKTRGDLKATQLFLRHASIQTTGDVYLDYNNYQMAEKVAEALEGIE